jgi:predicted Zn-dependent protease
MPHENALAMVLAHEIAHLARRHPIRSFGRAAGVSLVMSLLGLAETNPVQGALGQAGALTVLGYSRAQEREADRMALDAVHALYGHVGGATDLFRLFGDLRAQSGGIRTPEFASTHPSDDGRIEQLEARARESGFAMDPQRVPLRPVLRVGDGRPASRAGPKGGK